MLFLGWGGGQGGLQGILQIKISITLNTITLWFNQGTLFHHISKKFFLLRTSSGVQFTLYSA